MNTSPDKASPPPKEDAKKPWLKYLGVGAFWFFLIKGLLWLIVPGVLLWFGFGGEATE